MKTSICNMCGKTFTILDEYQDFSVYRYCGYGTEHDGDRLELDLCCDCMEKIIKACKINPVKEMTLEDI